ncbi:MAG TPA: hypothetical protein VJB65_01680 [Patescibacteria group bacterium]|nr:hypothetical protein [Patescibacteria group bacterium]
MEKNIISIQKQNQLQQKLQTMIQDGASKLHIITDFDGTLTKPYLHGKPTPSLISLLRDGEYLTPAYRKRAHELYEQYHAIEKDPNVPRGTKKKLMEEWWRKHCELLIKEGLTLTDLRSIAESRSLEFRNNLLHTLDLLHEYSIPLVIMSSSGVGDAISLMLGEADHLYDNMYIITNSFEWDINGKAIYIQEPLIYSLNKDETLLQSYPTIYSAIKDRTNVILLGDNIEDRGMIEGFPYKNLITIGFLPHEYKKYQKQFEKKFDVLLSADASMDYVYSLIQQIISEK